MKNPSATLRARDAAGGIKTLKPYSNLLALADHDTVPPILPRNLATSDNDDNSKRTPWKRANVATQCLMPHALQCKSHTMFKITPRYRPVIGDSFMCALHADASTAAAHHLSHLRDA